jgi:hypothetical protein
MPVEVDDGTAGPGHYKWIVHGAAGLRGTGNGCTRMRRQLHLPFLGHALVRASGDNVKACSSFRRLAQDPLRCDTLIYSSAATSRYKPVDSLDSEAAVHTAEAALWLAWPQTSAE